MAKFDVMIPHILHCETGVPIKYLSLPHEQIFERAKKTGYANDPADLGGATMCGVTISTYREYRRKKGYKSTTVANLKAITFNEWKEILKSMFWDRWKADNINDQMIACALVDWVWGSGTYGIKKPQGVLGVVADGIVGPKTLAAINNYPNPQELFNKIQDARNKYHAAICVSRPANKKFLRGWNRRVAMIQYDGFHFDVK